MESIFGVVGMERGDGTSEAGRKGLVWSRDRAQEGVEDGDERAESD